MLWRVNFEDGLLISDRSVSVASAEEAGVPAQDALRLLTPGEYESEVLAREIVVGGRHHSLSMISDS